jgi:hypothetical protein
MTSIARPHLRLPFAAIVTILAIVVLVVAWLEDAGAVAGVAGLVAFAAGATVAGADSRSRGDGVSTSRV